MFLTVWVEEQALYAGVPMFVFWSLSNLAEYNGYFLQHLTSSKWNNKNKQSLTFGRWKQVVNYGKTESKDVSGAPSLRLHCNAYNRVKFLKWLKIALSIKMQLGQGFPRAMLANENHHLSITRSYVSLLKLSVATVSRISKSSAWRRLQDRRHAAHGIFSTKNCFHAFLLPLHTRKPVTVQRSSNGDHSILWRVFVQRN